MGRVLSRGDEVDAIAALERGTEIVGLLFLSGAGVVKVNPTIEAWMLASKTCVPGPA
jgi:hypothetical protein